jgi:hypothetical protein
LILGIWIFRSAEDGFADTIWAYDFCHKGWKPF